jgi:sugar phosphate permease
VGDAGRGNAARKGRQATTPWARMLRHPAVWAIVVNNFTFHYAFYVVMNWLPTYFDQVRNSKEQEETFASGVLKSCMWTARSSCLAAMEM